MVRTFRSRSTDGRRETPTSSMDNRHTQSTTFTRRSLRLSVMPSFFPRRAASGPTDISATITSPSPSPSQSSSHATFDTLALIRRLPIRASALCYVRSGRHLSPFSRFERFCLQLRGRLVIMLMPHHLPSTQSSPTLTDHILSRDTLIVSIFSVERCLVLKPRSKSPLLKLSHPNQPHFIWLRFDSDADCYTWEKALTSVAAQRVVGISDFEFISPIGKGASGKVFLVSDRSTGEKLALKVIDKSKVFESRSAFRHALDERLALEMVDGHPFFSRLRYAFQTRAYFYLAIDFYHGGDLYQYLRTHLGKLRESQVRAVSAQVLLALEHLHGLGFIYRDLKPENVLLDSKGHVRLADFGLCKLLPDKRLTSTICGTHTYAAPEILSARSYGKSIDLWAFGVFVYHILRGRTPYEARDLDQVIVNMSNRRIRFSPSTSPELVSMVKKLLDWNPDTRLGCGIGGMVEVRGHSFFKGLDWRKVYLRDDNLPGLFSKRGISSISTDHRNNSINRTRVMRNKVCESSETLKSGNTTRENLSSTILCSHTQDEVDQIGTIDTSRSLGLSGHVNVATKNRGVVESGEADGIGVSTTGHSLGGLVEMGNTGIGFGCVEEVEGRMIHEQHGHGNEGEINEGRMKGNGNGLRGSGRLGTSEISTSDAFDNEKMNGSLWRRKDRGNGRRKLENDQFINGHLSIDKMKSCTSLREQMEEAAEEDDLRNFDMSEWGKISVDVDHDDLSYGDGGLWPFSRARRKLLEEDRMVAGFGYCSMSNCLGLPEYL